MIKFVIHGPVKGGKNNMLMTRTGRHYPNPAWAAWRDGILAQLGTQLRIEGFQETYTNPCIMTVEYWPSDKRRRDVPAMIDSIFHILEKAHIIADDCLIEDVSWTFRQYDKMNGRAEIEIREKL
mgnify:CR=1 FL=1